MTRRTTTTRVSRVAALLAACALAASLSSCGRSDPVQQEIDRVSVGLNALSTSGSTAVPSVDYRRAMYQWAVDRMSGRASAHDPIATEIARPAGTYDANDPGRPQKKVADAPAPASKPTDSTNAGQAAAANLLLARGYAGLGEISAQEAAGLEGSAALQVSPISAALDQWLSQNAAADALAAYDPAADIAVIEKQIGEKQKLADDARASKDRQVAAIAGLEKQAADLTARSRAMREQEAQVRGRTSGVSETVRLELITEATRIRREADQVEKEAANLLARVAVQKPEADTLQRGIDELATQMQLLRTDKDNLRQRADQRTAAAKRARDEAQSAATRLTQMLGALTTAREALAAPTDAATGAYEKAVGAARKAGQAYRESKGQGAIAAGNYQHALADILATKARGHAAYAELLTTLANAKPALPGAADLATKATAAAEAAKTAFDAATAAFEAALTQYSAAGGSGDTQDRLQALEASLNALLGKTPEPAPDATPAAPDAPDGAAPAAAAPAAADLAAVETEVRVALEQFIAAAKASDFSALRGFMLIRDEAARPAFESLLDVAAGPAALNAACQKAYSKPFKQVVDESSVQSVKQLMAGMQQGIDQLASGVGNFESMSAAAATIAPVSATEATVTFPPAKEGDAPEVLKVVKDAGTWKIDTDAQLAAMGGADGLKAMAPMLAPMKAVSESFTKVAGKLGAGDYADADAMLIDLNKEITAAMFKAGGLLGPGGGPGGGGENGGGGSGGG